MRNERHRELARRRTRRKKLALIKKRAEKASASEKQVLAAKIRRLTPGAEQLIEAYGLSK
jgi:hypothetical protein